jgi:hypothetical protein
MSSRMSCWRLAREAKPGVRLASPARKLVFLMIPCRRCRCSSVNRTCNLVRRPFGILPPWWRGEAACRRWCATHDPCHDQRARITCGNCTVVGGQFSGEMHVEQLSAITRVQLLPHRHLFRHWGKGRDIERRGCAPTDRSLPPPPPSLYSALRSISSSSAVMSSRRTWPLAQIQRAHRGCGRDAGRR